MSEVAEDPGNNPAVSRSPYVDLRITEAFLRGGTIDVTVRGERGPDAEKALLRLLRD